MTSSKSNLPQPLAGVTRLEVHSYDTRLVRYAVSNVEAHLQDDGKTLKIFFNEGTPEESERFLSNLWKGAISDASA